MMMMMMVTTEVILVMTCCEELEGGGWSAKNPCRSIGGGWIVGLQDRAKASLARCRILVDGSWKPLHQPR